MTTNSFPPSTIGWTAITTGSAAILAVITLTLMAAVNQSFGRVNDVFNSIIGISSAVLAWMLYAEHHTKSPLISHIVLLLAGVGAIFTIVGSVLIVYGYTDFVLAGWYTGSGNALIGLWLAAFCTSMLRGDTLPHNLAVFGLVVGGVMAVGLIGIPGIFAGIDSMDMPRYLYTAFFGYLGTYILYPFWTIWLGRFLLSK